MAITPITANPPTENTDPWYVGRSTFDQQVKATANAAASAADQALLDAATAQSGLGNKVNTSTYTAGMANKADLVGGVIPTAQLPALAITEFLGTVATQVAMLALAGQKGDWAIRTDTGTTWVITGDTPSQIGSWTQIIAPGGAAPVLSVNGQTGAVVLGAADVNARADTWTPAVGDVPDLPASKVTSGTFDPARIPALDPSKVTDGAITSPNGSVSQIEWYASVEDFPATGVTGGIYLTDKAE